MKAAECPTVYGGDLWDGVPRVSFGGGPPSCPRLCRGPRRGWPGQARTDDFNVTGKCSNRRNAPAETALTGPALCKQAENGFMPSLDICNSTRRAIALAAGIGLLTLAFAAPAQENGITPSEISIGAIGALTGPLAFIGTPGRDSMTLAFDEINAKGGVCGRKLRLDFEHASSPAESIAAVKKLVEQDKVFVLVLASGSTGAAAAADYVRAAGSRPIISTAQRRSSASRFRKTSSTVPSFRWRYRRAG